MSRPPPFSLPSDVSGEEETLRSLDWIFGETSDGVSCVSTFVRGPVSVHPSRYTSPGGRVGVVARCPEYENGFALRP